MGLSDITFSQDGRDAGTSDVIPVHCLALALDPWGRLRPLCDSDP